MTINEYLKNKRRGMGLKQADIAPKLGVSLMGLSYLENGTRNIKIKMLRKWAKLLDLEVQITFIEKEKVRQEVDF